jgi:hypothetical protein
MTASDFAIVFATFMGPIAAVQLQKFLDRRGERERRRVEIYRALMAFRANPSSPQYVDALNAVPLEFHKVKLVMDAYADFLAHLNTTDNGNLATWNQTRQTRFIDLLKTMGKALRYSFRDAELLDHAYLPTWQLNLQTDQEIVRKGMVALMSGKEPLPMKVTGFPTDPDALKNQIMLQTLLIEWLEGKRSPLVKTDSGKAST